VTCRPFLGKELANTFRGDEVLGQKPSLVVKETFPRIREWKLQTSKTVRCCGTHRRVHGSDNARCRLVETGNQTVAAEPTDVSMEATKQ
jgi:hypothetical protein